MFRKNKRILGIFLLLVIICIPVVSSAQYDPLAEGLERLYDGSGTLGDFFNGLFEIALAIGSTLAVLIIAISGLQYMTTEAATDKTQSKERMQQAVLGLLMLLSVWLFFAEINPDILNLNFSLSPTNVSVTSPTPSGSTNTNTSGRAPDILPDYTNETWTRMPVGATCSSVRGEGWEEVREYRCPGTSPYGTASRDCCALNPNYVSDAHANGTIYPPSDRRNLPSGSWCYTLPNSSSNCFSDQSSCSAAISSDPNNPQGGCGEVR